MANISYTKVGDTTYPLSLPYCVCGTTASTAAKTADLANFSLDEGTTVHVKFTNANTATTPTLNINGTGAKGIKAYGTTAPSVNWKAGAVVEFVYDGTNYVMTNVGAIPDGTCTVSGGGLSKGTASGGGLSGGALSGGGLSAGAGAATITTAPVVTPNVGGTVVGKTAYGVTTTKPSGTDGTNYVTIDPGATVTTTGKAKGKGTVSRATINRAQVDRAAFSQSVTRADIKDAHTAGYIPAKSATTVISGTSETVSLASGKLDAASIASASQDSNWSSEINITPSVGDGTNYYIPMSSTSATGGSASVAVTGMVTTTTDTGYKVSASATGGSASVTAGLTSGGSASGTSASTVTFINAGVESFSGGGLSKGTASGGGLSGGALSGGDLSAGAGAATITTAPVVTPSVGGTVVGKTAYGVTTTKPSGTDGTNYFTIDPGGSVTTTGKAKGKGTVSRATINRAQVDRAAFSQAVTRATITEEHNAGYFPASTNLVLGSGSETVSLAAGKIDATSIASTSKDSNWSSEVNITPSVGAGTNYYVPVVSPSVTGGSASVAVTGMVTTTTDTGYKVSASAAGGSASIGAGITSGGSSSGGSAATVTFINAGVESFSGGGLSKGTATGGTISGGGLSGGGLNAGTGEVSITANPVVTPSVGGTVVGKTTYGVTTTKPSGTDGTNYFTIDPGASVTEGKAKGRGTVSRDGVTRAAINRAAFSQSVTRATITEEHNAGYFPASTNLVLGSGSETVSLAAGSIAADTTTIPSASKTSNWSGESSTSSTVTAGTNYYVPVVTATATNGTASASATITKAAGSTITASSATITVSGMTTTTTATSYKIIASANSGFAKAWSGKAKANASATGGSASVGAGITSGASASGTSTGAKSAETTESTAQTTAQSAATTIYIPAGVCTVAGGGLSKGTASGGTLTGGALSNSMSDLSAWGVNSMGVGASTTTAPGSGSGYYVAISGYATATRGAVSRATFTQSVTRAAVTDAHTAGYIPDKAATTVISAATETVALGSGSLASATIASSTLTKYYKIATGSCTVDGGGLSKGTASGGGLSGGTLNSGAGEVSITANPVVTPSVGGTVVGKTAYGVTTTKPSGTDGTNYFTIDPGASVTEGKAKGRGTVTRDAVSRAAFSQKVTRADITDAHTAGYIPDKAATTVISSASETVSLAADTTTIPYASKTSTWSSESSTSSTVTAGTNYYVPVVTATATGGSASASATITKAAWSTITASSATITTSGITTSETATSYVIVAKANSGFAKAGSGIAKADASANGGSASVGAGITSGASASGTNTGAKSAQTTESTAQTTAQSASATIYIPAGGVTSTAATVSVGLQNSTGTLYRNDTATTQTQTDALILGTVSDSAPASGMYLAVAGGVTKQTKSGVATVTKTTGYIGAGTISVSTNIQSGTNTRYYPVTIKSGSASVADATKASTSTSLSGTTLTVQASVSPTVTAGWVSSGSAGTIKITGTVPTQSKAASGSGTVSPDTGKLLSSVTVAAGSASVADATKASTSTSLSGTTLTVQASVSPTVSAGWVSSGSAGTIKITGTVPTETKSATGAGDVTPSTGKLLSKVTIGAGSAAVTASTYSSVGLTLSGTSYSASVDVTPDVTAGWVDSGTPGTITITGTVPTQMKTATASGVITPDAGKLLSGVTVSIPSGTATVAAATVSVTLQNSTGTLYRNDTATTQTQTDALVLGTVSSSTPTSGMYLAVAGGVSKQTKSGVALLTKTAGYIAAGTVSVSTNIKVGTNTRYYPVTIKAGSASANAVTVTPNALVGTWNSTAKEYQVTQASKTFSITGTASAGWVTSVSSATGTLSAPGYLAIPGGTITINTSGGSSSGTINPNSQIMISAGYYPNDLWYQAGSGGSGSWSTWTNMQEVGNLFDPTGQMGSLRLGGAYDGDIYYLGYTPYYYGSSANGTLNGYMSETTNTGLQIPWGADTTDGHMTIALMLKEDNWSYRTIYMGTKNYKGYAQSSTSPYSYAQIDIPSGKITANGGTMLVIQVYAYHMDNYYHVMYRYLI